MFTSMEDDILVATRPSHSLELPEWLVGGGDKRIEEVLEFSFVLGRHSWDVTRVLRRDSLSNPVPYWHTGPIIRVDIRNSTKTQSKGGGVRVHTYFGVIFFPTKEYIDFYLMEYGMGNLRVFSLRIYLHVHM